MIERSAHLHEAVNDLSRLYDVERHKIIQNEDMFGDTHHLEHALNYITTPGAGKLWRRFRAQERSHTDTVPQPTTELGSLACTYARVLLGNPDIFAHTATCSESEPRLMESLIAAEESALLEEDQGRSTIYIDKDGQPVAYKKNYGEHVTYILRQSSHFPTVPEGTIVTKFYEDPSVPYLGSVPLKPRPAKNNPQLQLAEVDTHHGLAVVRPSIYTLSPEFRASATHDIKNKIAKQLNGYADMATSSTLASITNRVDDLTASLKV